MKKEQQKKPKVTTKDKKLKLSKQTLKDLDTNGNVKGGQEPRSDKCLSFHIGGGTCLCQTG
jgi:hypothetical protein